MIISLNIWVILFTGGFVIGLFMALLFLIFHKKYSKHVHNITVILFILSIMLLNEVMEESDFVDIYPSLISVTIVADLIIWPFFLFYVQFIVGNRNTYQMKDVLCFLPFVIGFIWQLPFLFLEGEKKLSYYDNGIPNDIAVFVAFKMIVMLIFLAYILVILNTGLKQFRSIFPMNKKALFLGKANLLFKVLSICFIIVYLLFFVNYFNLIGIGDSDQIGSLVITSLFFLFGIMVFRKPDLFREENYSQTIIDFFGGDEKKYVESLLLLFSSTKPYLNPKIVIKEVASLIGLSVQQLSYILNRQLGVTFQDFVNTYRIKEVKKSLNKEDHLHKTLVGVAMDSGFSGKATFNRVFKEHTGQTPTDYINCLKK